MHSVQMLTENIIVEEELLAEIAPWMREYFGAALVGGVAVLDMQSQLLGVVDALLANEDRAALETHQAERLLVRGLHVPPQAFLIGELLLVLAVVHQAGQSAQFHALDLRVAIRVVNRLIRPILVALVSPLVVKNVPRERLVRCNYNLF